MFLPVAPDRGGTEGGAPEFIVDDEVVAVLDLNPDGGCCCAEETLGVEAEAALPFVSQGLSGVAIPVIDRT